MGSGEFVLGVGSPLSRAEHAGAGAVQGRIHGHEAFGFCGRDVVCRAVVCRHRPGGAPLRGSLWQPVPARGRVVLRNIAERARECWTAASAGWVRALDLPAVPLGPFVSRRQLREPSPGQRCAVGLSVGTFCATQHGGPHVWPVNA